MSFLEGENIKISLEAFEIINRDLKDNEEKKLVAQILNNYYVRGLLWEEDERYKRSGITDETIAVTELIVLTNCLRKLHCGTKEADGNEVV